MKLALGRIQKSIEGLFGHSHNEFLPGSRAILETPPAPLAGVVAVTICFLTVSALVGAAIARVDIYATADGRIQPVGRSKIIQPAVEGRVARIFVTDGVRVKAGETLLELEADDARALQFSADDQEAELMGEIARRAVAIRAAKRSHLDAGMLQLLRQTVPPSRLKREQDLLSADVSQLSANVTELKAREEASRVDALAAETAIAAHQKTLASLEERASIRTQLSQDGWDTRMNALDARVDVDKERIAVIAARAQLSQAVSQSAIINTQIATARSSFIDENEKALRDARGKLDQAHQSSVRAHGAVGRTVIISPIAGIVQQLSITTLGQVVATGDQIMTIVPESTPLELEAELSNRDVAFVHAGQEALVKVESFPFTRYGTIRGTVARVSRDSVPSREVVGKTDTRTLKVSPESSGGGPTPQIKDLVYPVTVRLEHSTIRVNGNNLPLSPGMNVTVEILTGRRSVLSFILSPFTEVASEAGHER